MDGPATFQQVVEVDPSTAFPAWEGGQIVYRFDGTKVWATSNNNSSTNPPRMENIQLVLNAIWQQATSVSGTNAVASHMIHVEYVIDLYRPQELTVYPSIRRPAPLFIQARPPRPFGEQKGDEPDLPRAGPTCPPPSPSHTAVNSDGEIIDIEDLGVLRRRAAARAAARAPSRSPRGVTGSRPG